MLETKPHDKTAFTQGLAYENGILYEGTGLYGQSLIRKQDFASQETIAEIKLPEYYFGEGITLTHDSIFQLTWREGKGLIYDKEGFYLNDEFIYPGEGWGLAYDGHNLIMTNGSAELQFMDPTSFIINKRLTVTENDRPVPFLNELEYVDGQLFANVWKTDRILRIDPQTGKVTGMLDLSELLPPEDRTATTDVLNGIAYDSSNDTFLITGKNWPKLFILKIEEEKI